MTDKCAYTVKMITNYSIVYVDLYKFFFSDLFKYVLLKYYNNYIV